MLLWFIFTSYAKRTSPNSSLKWYVTNWVAQCPKWLSQMDNRLFPQLTVLYTKESRTRNKYLLHTNINALLAFSVQRNSFFLITLPVPQTQRLHGDVVHCWFYYEYPRSPRHLSTGIHCKRHYPQLLHPKSPKGLYVGKMALLLVLLCVCSIVYLLLWCV